MKIPFLRFDTMHQPIKQEMLKAFETFYDSNWYVLGESIKNFEKEYAAFNQVDYCVGVSNGLDAIILALRALGIGPGDEVIVPSNTYIATWLAVSHVGATPVGVEPDPCTYNINPKLIEEKLTDKTKAILPVHLYGQCCEMEEIMALSKQYNLFVVEDNAQSQGSTLNGRKTGSFGHVNATSFYPGKNLGALGDSGAVTTNDAHAAEYISSLRNYGSAIKYYNEFQGYNMRMDECQAALLSVKLKYLDLWTEQRQLVASWYSEMLNDIGDLILPTHPEHISHVYHLYVVRTERRNELQSYLAQHDIGTLIHYPVPPHKQKAYANVLKGDIHFPLAEKLADTCLSLPLWPGMQRNEVEFVSDAIKRFFQH